MNKKKIIIMAMVLTAVALAVFLAIFVAQYFNEKRAEKRAGYPMSKQEAAGFSQYYTNPEKLKSKQESDQYLSELNDLKTKVENSN